MNTTSSHGTGLLGSIRAAVAVGRTTLVQDGEEQISDTGDARVRSGPRSDSHIASLSLPRLELVPPFRVKSQGYRVDDFLVFNDWAFINAAYRGLLAREPDTAGAEPYLHRLRLGASKLEILGRIRYSPEGRTAGVNVTGLPLRAAYAMAGAVPFLGYAFRWAVSLLRLPRLVEHHRALEYRALAQIDAVAAHDNDVAALITAHVAAMEAHHVRTAGVLKELMAGNDALEAKHERTAREMTLISDRQSEHEAASGRMVRRLEALASTSEDTARAARRLASDADQVRSSLEAVRHDNEQRLAGVSLSLTAIEQSFAQAREAEERKARRLDPFYAAFEERFRGERHEIKERVGFYLNIVRSAGIGGPSSPILDVGCGRGEWLELLKESGLQGHGVDTNRTCVTYCRRLGLDVTEQDAVACLTGAADGSMGGVIGLHIIEHLPFGDLLELIDQAHRVLIAGGAVMFETPNPGNVLVGTNNFYTDPTHARPLPAELMKFTLEARGFSRVEVTPLHPYPAELLLKGDEIAKRFNDHFYGAQDYAVIGWK